MRILVTAASILALGAMTVTTAAPTEEHAAPFDRAEYAARVRAEFLHSWSAYQRLAWGHDELRPLSRAPRDWYGESLGITPVDALDTLVLLGPTSLVPASPVPTITSHQAAAHPMRYHV